MRLAVVLVVVTACTSSVVAESTTPHGSISTSSTSTTAATTTTNDVLRSNDTGLYRVDPATLIPIPGTEPLTAGGLIDGYSSPNGDWLALQLWFDTMPETNLIQVIETSTGEVVTEKPGIIGDFLGMGDNGVVYQMLYSGQRGYTLRQLIPGGDHFHPVPVELPREFVTRESVAFLDQQRIAWFGRFRDNPDANLAGVVVVDLTTGEAKTHVIEGLTIGSVDETELGEWSLQETVGPAVVWDSPRDRVFIVHGDEDAVTTLGLGTGALETRPWSQPTSWLDSLFAWLIPPVQAKGPDEYGVTRNAAISQSGELLYVATSVAEVVIESDGDWFVQSTPRGVEAIGTETWEVVHRWDIPASEVSLSPDGKHLIATGTTWTESPASSHVQSKDVSIIETDTNELVVRFPAFEAWQDVHFSPEGDYAYLGTCCGGGRFDIVDLASLEVIGRSEQGSLFEDALLFATGQP
jgi:hypothetical protein